MAVCLALSWAGAAPAWADDIQAEREHWAAHARQSEAALGESVAALQKLYAQSGDAKVRADLIALLVRQGRAEAALAVCSRCVPEDYRADELENLAKAARDKHQFVRAVMLYQALQQQAPQQKIGWLGAALANVDAHEYAAAKLSIAAYRQRFGNDEAIGAAEQYLNEQSKTLAERLGELQQQLSAQPGNHEVVMQLYRTAGGLQAYPVQEGLMAQYPQLFGRNDRLWLNHAEAVTQLRASKEAGNRKEGLDAYRRLSLLVEESTPGSDLHTRALRDRMLAAVTVGKGKQALHDYRQLTAKGAVQPEYVEDAYARALVMEGSPRKALKVFQAQEQKQLAQSGRVDPELVEKLVQAQADMGQFDRAQAQLNTFSPNRKRPDFTHTTQINNPYYERQYFWQVRLDAWNGNMKNAIALMDKWLSEHPGDPWAMILRGELAYWNGRNDEAEYWFNEAMLLLPPEGQSWARSNRGNILMANGNWKGAAAELAAVPPDNPDYDGLRERSAEARAAHLSVSAGIFRATSPKDSGNEWQHNSVLYSPRSEAGHRAYVRWQNGYVPNHGDELRFGRVGAGGELSFYPFNVSLEAGHGLQLNNKAYFSAGAGYRINQHWSLSANAALNSANTPAKALNQDVYADEYTLGANYVHNADTRLGAGLGWMDFDDGNLRQGAYLWASQTLWQRNRWKLNGALWADYSRNKDIPAAAYYNPKSSKSVSGDLSLSYALPLDGGISLTQQLGVGSGRYWQAEQKGENTWTLKYGHDWRLGKRVGLSYEAGRKKAIYDGDAEYQLFGNVGLNVRFQ